MNKKIIVMICVFTLLAFLPIIVGYLTQTEDLIFTGRTLSIHTFYFYQSWLLQAAEGNFMFTEYRTSENVPSLFISIPFIVLGQLIRITGADLMTAYFIAYIVSSIALMLAIYIFICRIFHKEFERNYTFAFTMLAGGFGVFFWILSRMGELPYYLSESTNFASRVFPIDIFLTDAFPLLTMHAYLLHTISMAMIVFALYLFLEGWMKNNIKMVMASSILSAIIGFSHIYDIIIVMGVITLFTLLKGKRRLYLFYIILPLITLLINIQIFVFHDVFSEITNNFIALTPNPYSIVLGLGIPGILAFLLIAKKRIFNDDRLFFTFIWFMTYLMLFYLPVPFQIRMSMGLMIPVSILACSYIFSSDWRDRINRLKTSNVLLAVLLITVSLSTIFFIAKETYKLHDPEDEKHYYVTAQEVEALEWIKQHDGIYLSDMYSSEMIAGINRRVYVAYITGGTFNHSIKKAFMEKFLDTLDLSMLKRTNITHIYLNPVRELPLDVLFRNEEVVIYDSKEYSKGDR